MGSVLSFLGINSIPNFINELMGEEITVQDIEALAGDIDIETGEPLTMTKIQNELLGEEITQDDIDSIINGAYQG